MSNDKCNIRFILLYLMTKLNNMNSIKNIIFFKIFKRNLIKKIEIKKKE